jgi:PAS domain S-box-containing protein
VDELLNTAPCGFLSFGDDGKIRLINETLLEILGYTRGDIVGQHVESILTIGSRIFYQTHWFPLLRLHGHAEEIFILLRPRSGDDIGVLINAVRRERDDGLAYECVLMQVRERRKYEDELLRARRTAEVALAELEVRKQGLQEAHDKLAAQAEELEQRQRQLREQTALLEEAGEELTVINEHLLARTEEAEQLRAAAEEANRAKSNFLAVMSHELRTPLNAISGYVQLLEMGIHGPVTEPQRTALDRIGRSQRHLLSLINDVLNLARIEAGRVDYFLEDVSVAEVVAAVAPMIEPQLHGKEITFATDIPGDLAVRADREKLQQILLNLLSNAVKFTPAGGKVIVDATRSDAVENQVLIRVGDTGIGIAREKLEAIFHPFVQVDVSHSRTTEGSGLGLAISRDLARGMGGDLSATSRVAQGSTFAISLPSIW